MIELTTGVMFLMTSLYGAGQADSHVASIANAEILEREASTTLTINASETNNPEKMEEYLKQEFAETPLLVEIARCESNFHQFDKDGNVVRGIKNSSDVGVMQINEHYHDDAAVKLGYDLHTVEGNVAYAKYLYDREGSRPWNASSKCWSVSQTIAKN